MDQFRFRRLVEEYQAELYLVPFELRPQMPDEGLSAAEHGLGHSERVDERLKQLAALEGRAMVIPDLIPKTHLAMVLSEVARDRSPEVYRAVHEAIFDAYYVEGRNIGEVAELTAIAEANGIEASVLEAAWENATYEERLHQFYHLALSLGITSTPAALICNELIIGTRPYGVLRAAIERCLVTPASLATEEEPSEATSYERGT